MSKAYPKKRRRSITAREFVGTKMANFLHSLKQSQFLPHEMKAEAEKLQEQWDSVCSFRLNNPIVIAELEAQFRGK